jgi:hypothetical protein
MLLHRKQKYIYKKQTYILMSTDEFRAVSGQNRHFQPKPSPPGQYGSNHVDQGKK